MVKVKKQRTKRPPPADDDAALLNGMGNMSLTPSSSSSTRSECSPHLAGMPTSVLHNIISLLLAQDKWGSVSALSMTSRELHHAVTPALYAEVTIREGRWSTESGEQLWDRMFEMKESFGGLRRGKHTMDSDGSLVDPLECIRSLTVMTGNTSRLSDLYKLLSQRSHQLHTLNIHSHPSDQHIDQILFPEPQYPMNRLAKLHVNISANYCLGCPTHPPQRIAPVLATPFLTHLSLTLDPHTCSLWLAQARGEDPLGRQQKKPQPDPRIRFQKLKVLDVVTGAAQITAPIRFAAICCPSLLELVVEASPTREGSQDPWEEVVNSLASAASIVRFDLTVSVDSKATSNVESQLTTSIAGFPSRARLLGVFRDVRKTRRNFSDFSYRVRSSVVGIASAPVSPSTSITNLLPSSKASRNDEIIHPEWKAWPIIASFTAEWASGTGQIVATCNDLDAPDRELVMLAADQVEVKVKHPVWTRSLGDSCV